MSLKMSALNRTNSGCKARKIVPADCRADYKRLFGIGREIKFSLPAGISPNDVKARFAAWLSAVEAGIAAIRARNRGEAQSLTQKQAHAIISQWYRWWIRDAIHH